MRNTLVLLAASLLLCATEIQAQISKQGTPNSREMGLSDTQQIILLPTLDLNALYTEDVIDEENGLPPRFGYLHDVHHTLWNSGEWIDLPNGTSVWRLKIKCPDATSININYDDFHLVKGAEYFVYASDRSQTLGAFTTANNKPHRQFATGVIITDEVIVELNVPTEKIQEVSISISGIIHGYESVYSWAKDFGDSGNCNVNVNCPEGDEWQNESASVVVLLTFNNYRFCTGALINNADYNCIPYMLTANHCIDESAGQDVNYIFMFNYDSPTCSDQDGDITQTVQGGVIRANAGASDFCLIELDDQPADFYDVFYSGWSRENVAPTRAVAIHHPSGDLKKISFEEDPTAISGYFGNGSTHIQVFDWDLGTTEGGSSGSPLFNLEHQIVGQLHGGWAACGNNDQDYYGRMYYSWDQSGNNANSQLKTWLDPSDTGVLKIGGVSGNCESAASCEDSIMNGDETGIDCGGNCDPCENRLFAKLMLEGFVNGSEMQSGYMSGILPMEQPFNDLFGYSGTETIENYEDVVDWIFIQARNSNALDQILDETVGLLKKDGSIVSMDGTDGVAFEYLAPNNEYRFAFFHKSHLAVISKFDIDFPDEDIYDFTSNMTMAFGAQQQVETEAGFALFAGDFDNNGVINVADFNTWIQNSAGVNVYEHHDADGNAIINVTDFNLWLKNVSKVGNTYIQ